MWELLLQWGTSSSVIKVSSQSSETNFWDFAHGTPSVQLNKNDIKHTVGEQSDCSAKSSGIAWWRWFKASTSTFLSCVFNLNSQTKHCRGLFPRVLPLKSFLPTASRRPALAKATQCCWGMVNKRLWVNAIRASPWGRWACTTPMCINCVILPADTAWASTAAGEAVQCNCFFSPWFVNFFLGGSPCSGLNPAQSNTALSLCGVGVNTGSVWSALGTSLLC